MIDTIVFIVSILLTLILSLILGYFIRVWHHEKSIQASKKLAEQIVEDGKKEASKHKKESMLFLIQNLI